MNHGLFSWFSFQNSCCFPKRASFEDILFLFKVEENENKTLLINTLPISEQSILIPKTFDATIEEHTINEIVERQHQHQWTIFIYGRNSTDHTIEKRYKQIYALGFSYSNIWIYYGGLFEYVMLQELYGKECFPLIGKITENDFFRLKPCRENPTVPCLPPSI